MWKQEKKVPSKASTQQSAGEVEGTGKKKEVRKQRTRRREAGRVGGTFNTDRRPAATTEGGRQHSTADEE